jgi:hypothetical protein
MWYFCLLAGSSSGSFFGATNASTGSSFNSSFGRLGKDRPLWGECASCLDDLKTKQEEERFDDEGDENTSSLGSREVEREDEPCEEPMRDEDLQSMRGDAAGGRTTVAPSRGSRPARQFARTVSKLKPS